ncbi:MAG: DNA translocase FtsK [Clostridiales Family XIII bacterium]|jgi:S-DNA-T family DNA segregation ATPase FtsK/SpoIIIE|nr:DNA translocase FtsK [Clostridiales Family XIII bacterium]
MANSKSSGGSSGTKKRSSSGAKRDVSNAARGKAAAQERARIHREIASIVLIALGAFLIFGLFANAAGKLGDVIDTGVTGVFGIMANALPFFLIAYGVLLLIGRIKLPRARTIFLASVAFLMLCILFAGHYVEAVSGGGAHIIGDPDLKAVFSASAGGKGGGVIGSYIAKGLVSLIGKAGLYILTIALLIISIILLANMSMSKAAGKVRAKQLSSREKRQQRREAQLTVYEDDVYEEPGLEVPVLAARKKAEHAETPTAASAKQRRILDAVKNDETYGDVSTPRGLDIEDTNVPFVPDAASQNAGRTVSKDTSPRGASVRAPGTPAPVPLTADADLGKAAEGKMHYGPPQSDSNYKLPPIDLLSKSKAGAKTESPAELKRNATRLEQAMRDFRVDAKVLKVTVGPTVTRYEVEPDVGVKIQAIRSLEPDLALKLEVKSVRVVPMPGQAVIGIEAYNANTSIVSLRDIIDSDEFRGEPSKIACALGKNVSGKRIIADLKEMPHLLIAGTTGSGKSVCINSILLSILYRAKPSEVKLILVDPKVVELKSYNDLPHLLVPVVTDPERAAMALSYAVTLMNDRYRKFSEHNVRNLESFNDKMRGEGLYEEVLPQIVIVIDELSDLMMVASAKVQESISRLAAMARAAGMHLIVATQQPLASILTSVIKANIPSRIAFAVSSNSASRVILDNPGAERLHGKGDMLFNPVGVREPMRVQGAFVDEKEVVKVVEFVKKQMDPDYSTELMAQVDSMASGSLTDDEDDLFLDAVEMVAQAKQASVSMIQRRFRVGYNRAARLVDMMEERGIVAPSDGTNKPRRLIMSEAQIAGFLSSGGRVDFVAGALTSESAPVAEARAAEEPPAFDEPEDLGGPSGAPEPAERPVRSFDDFDEFDD